MGDTAIDLSSIIGFVEDYGTPASILAFIVVLAKWRVSAASAAIKSKDSAVAYLRRIERLHINKYFSSYKRMLQTGLNLIARTLGDDDRAEAAREVGVDWKAPSAWNVDSYWIVLGIAALYPVLFLFGGWMTGGAGELATLPVLPDDIPIWQRCLMGGGLATAIAMVVVSRRAEQRLMETKRRWLRVLGTVVVPIAVLAAVVASVAIAITSASDSAMAGPVALACFVAVASFVAGGWTGSAIGAVAAGGAVAVVGAFTFAFAGAVAFAVAFASANAGVALLLVQRHMMTPAFVWPLSATLAAIFLVLFAADGANAWIDLGRQVPVGLVLFIGLLPAANAILDWVSLCVSRQLLNRIADGSHGWAAGIGYAALDLLLALTFLFLVAMVTIGCLALAEHLHRLGGASPVFDASDILGALRDPARSGGYVWVYLMLLTTLVPTVLHFMFAVIAAVTGVFGLPFGKWIIAKMEEGRAGDTDAVTWAAWAYGGVETAALSVALIGVFGTSWLVWTYAGGIGDGLLTMADGLLILIESWDGAPFFTPLGKA